MGLIPKKIKTSWIIITISNHKSSKLGKIVVGLQHPAKKIFFFGPFAKANFLFMNLMYGLL